MTISVFPPHPDNGFREYQARVGEFWVQGKSLGNAISNAVEAVEARGGKISSLRVIVQELGGDNFFSDFDRARRHELTAKQRERHSHGAELTEPEARELATLINAEIEASGKRSQKLSDESK